jgi:AraC-like DNA-binding protein
MAAPRERYVSAQETLQPWVTKIALVRSSSQHRSDAFYSPHAEPSLLVKWTRDGDAVISVIGPLTKARQKSFLLPMRYARFVLRAGRARAVLGVSMSELTDRIVPIDDLWPTSGRLRELLAPAGPARAVQVMYSAIMARVPTDTKSASRSALVDRALRRLDAGDGRIASVAQDLGVSDRHLRRMFLEDVGMTPKHYARITRLQRAVSSRRSASWVAAAYEAGFHDQSHLTRDFRDLLQLTPRVFWERHREPGV